MINETKETNSLVRRIIDPATIVIFGASGDLTKRKLVPALYTLACEGLMPERFQVLGVARSKMKDREFQERSFDGIRDYSRYQTSYQQHWPMFAENLTYLAGSYDDPETYRRLAARLDAFDEEKGTSKNRLFYLAIPPGLYPVVIEQLGNAGLSKNKHGWTRIIIEKPFGHDLESANQLNTLVHKHFNEGQVYRIDHYLGKEIKYQPKKLDEEFVKRLDQIGIKDLSYESLLSSIHRVMETPAGRIETISTGKYSFIILVPVKTSHEKETGSALLITMGGETG